MRRTVLVPVLLAALAPLGAGSCASPECTAAGCTNGLTVTGPELRVKSRQPLTVRTCVEDRCEDVRHDIIGADSLLAFVDMPMPKAGTDVDLRVAVRDRRGRLIAHARGRARVTESQPNGPSCPPTCRRVGVRIEGGRLVPR